MRNRLKTTTALIASLSLLAAGPGFPQTAETEVPMICADGNAEPCAPGVDLIPAPEVAEPEAAAPEVVEPEAASPEAPAAEAAPAPEAAPEAAAPEAPAAEVAPTPQPEAAPEPAAPEPAAPSEGADTPTDSTDAPAAAPAAPAAEPAPVEPTPVEPTPVESAPETAPVETDAAPAPEFAPAPETADPAATEAAPQTDPDAPADIAAEAPPVLPVQPDAATGEVPVAAAASADVTAETPAGAVVSEEVVTEETARSSDEDFANSVNQPAAAHAAPAAKAKDKGLSSGEKAILLGLGAVAVGVMLSNNRKVQLNSGDRVVVERPDGSYQIIKDDNALLRQPGSTVRTERFDDGSSRTTVTREDGTRIVTIRDAEYRVLRRVHVARDGSQTMLFDDTIAAEPIDVTRLPARAPLVEILPDADEADLRAALSHQGGFDRRYSLAQIRDIERVRAMVPVIDLSAITFETGSAAIRPDQAPALSRLGRLMKSYIDADPSEVFLIEGHTDAVGSAASNLALSDRRAESVALAMTEYFDVPPENMVVQGYGESFLKVPTQKAERLNRRASVRRITDLLRQADI